MPVYTEKRRLVWVHREFHPRKPTVLAIGARGLPTATDDQMGIEACYLGLKVPYASDCCYVEVGACASYGANYDFPVNAIVVFESD